MKEKPKLLLHTCCGPCSTSVVEKLAGDYHITMFFYNPNITDVEEYQKRLAGEIQYLQYYNSSVQTQDEIQLLEGEYDPESFYEAIEGLEQEAEGGKRCEVCQTLRLTKTAEMAKRMGFPVFATTLSVSPHKNHTLLCQIGRQLTLENEPAYLEQDFKKQAGYQRSLEISKEIGLYRQNYCGCEYSK